MLTRPIGKSPKNLLQAECDRIEDKLGDFPRERLKFYTPSEKFLTSLQLTIVAPHA